MTALKKLTLLHSNDLHGDFLAKEVDKELIGGITRLSGYVSQVRKEEPNTLYCIAGDMLQGSIIDSEFLGISTIEIMNLLSPDVATVGNHEVDYGLAHLLFLERCAKFPIVNSNLYIKRPYTRLFRSHIQLKVGGMQVMFIGITTEDIIRGINSDVLGSFVNIEDAAREVGRICNAHRHIDIDYTVLLTHIGFEEDKRLAALLDPQWGVDLIVGGHTHTILDEPAVVNGILIVQAGVGTKQIGRFDLTIDTDTNSTHDFSWQLIHITEENCPVDKDMERTIARFKEETDAKYDRVICHFAHELTHPDRYEETELGNLVSDILRNHLGVDIMMVGSGSIRKTSISTVMTLLDLQELFPYDDKVKQITVTGKQFRQMLAYVFRDEMFDKDHTEFYQYSTGSRIVYDRVKKDFSVLELDGKPIEDDALYTVGLQEFHYINFGDFFGFSIDEALTNAPSRVITTSIHDVLVESLSSALTVDAQVEGRIIVKE